MNILKKYAKKKFIFMLSMIITGVVTLIACINMLNSGTEIGLDNYESIFASMGSIATIVQIIFYLFLLSFLILVVLSGFYIFKKDKKEYFILFELVMATIISLFLLLAMPGVNSACKLMRAYASGNMETIFTIGMSGIQSMNNAVDHLNVFRYLAIFNFVVNIIVLLTLKNIITINHFTFSLEETNETSNHISTTPIHIDFQKIKDLIKNGMDTVKEFLPTKNGKITLGIVGVIIVLFVGYNIYDTFFNKTKIDLMPNVKVNFSGEDGKGYVYDIDPGTIKYDKKDEDISDFINSIYYDYDTSYTLKNGDKIEIRAVYDKDKAKNLKLEITNDRAKVKVEGLIINYSKASDIPDKIVKQIRKDCDNEMASEFKNSSYRTYKYEFDSMYFLSDDDYDDDIYAVYKVDSTSSFLNTTESFYVYARVSNINSGYLDKDNYIYINTLYDDSFHKLSDPTKIESIIRKHTDHSNITKFNE